MNYIRKDSRYIVVSGELSSMAKANDRFRHDTKGNHARSHAKEGEYKIPLKHRRAFWMTFGGINRPNKNKWVSLDIWKKYLKWRKDNAC